MTRFEVLKRIEKEEQFADLIVGFVEQYKTPEALAEALKTELTEEGLQTLRSTALEGYPLSFNEQEVTSKVDECIISVCNKVQNNESAPGEYADTVEALAALVEARAKLGQLFNGFA